MLNLSKALEIESHQSSSIISCYNSYNYIWPKPYNSKNDNANLYWFIGACSSSGFGATAIFWTLSLFIKRKPIEKKDRFTILKCGLFGMSINIAAFIAGLDYSTPVNSSILIIVSPIFVVILSFFMFKQRINFFKILGIFLGFYWCSYFNYKCRYK